MRTGKKRTGEAENHAPARAVAHGSGKKKKQTKAGTKPQSKKKPPQETYPEEEIGQDYGEAEVVVEPTVEFDETYGPSVAFIYAETTNGKIEKFRYIHDERVKMQVRAIQDDLERASDEHARHLTMAESKHAEQIKQAQAEMDALRRELQEARERRKEVSTEPQECIMCLQPVKSAWRLECTKCGSHSHYQCATLTLYRDGRRVDDSHCPECARRDAMVRTDKYRVELMNNYDRAPERGNAPTADAMLAVCVHCKVGGTELQIMNSKEFQWSTTSRDRVYSFYKTVTIDMMVEHKLQMRDLLKMGITISHLMDKGLRFEKLVGPRGSHTLRLSPEDIDHTQADATALVRLGINSVYIRRNIKEWSTIRRMNLSAESLCIYGFTVIELIMRALRKENLQHVRCNQEQWVRLLGLDKEAFLLLNIKRDDFRSETLRGWQIESMQKFLRITSEEFDAYFGSTEDKKSRKLRLQQQHFQKQSRYNSLHHSEGGASAKTTETESQTDSEEQEEDEADDI